MRSSFQEMGPARRPYENPWFGVVEQDVAFLRPDGTVKGTGSMNYVDMTPGALVVCVDGNSHTGRVLLAPQERYTVNVIEGKPVRHYELPGGAFDENPDRIIDNGGRELYEEFGMVAQDMDIVGPARGHMPHPTLTDRNVTLLARGISRVEGGSVQDITESIGDPEWFGWREIEEMTLNTNGLWHRGEFKVISSEPTIASIGLVRAHLARTEPGNLDAQLRRQAGLIVGQFT